MIMIDHRHTTTKEASSTLKGMLIGFAVAIALIAAISDVAATKQVIAADSVIGATYDNLMSEEMAAYTVLYGHNETFTEFDMQ